MHEHPTDARKTQDNPRRLPEDHSYRSKILEALFLSTIIPLVLMEISTTGSDFINGLVVSQFLGTTNMAVQGLGSPYFSITGVVAGLLVTGMQTMCSKAYGAGDVDRVNGIYSMATIVGAVISIVLAFAFLVCCDPIGRALGAVGESIDLLPSLKLYLMGLGIGTPAIVLASLLMPLVQMNGGGSTVRTSVIASLVIVIAINLFVGISGGTMFGIGLATSIARWTQFLILFVYARGPKSTIRFTLAGIEWSEFGSMVFVGLPKAIRRVANMLRPLFLNRLVLALGGSAAMSAMSIRNSLDGIGDVVGSGIAAAVMLLVGILYGEENREGIIQITRLTLKYIGIGVGAVALVLFVGAPWLATFYAKDATEVARLATPAIRCMAVNLVLNALIEAYINFLQATEQTLKTHIVNVASRFVCVVACAFMLGSMLGIGGVWLAFPVGSLVLMAAVAIATMLRKKTVAIDLPDILGLPADFGAAPEDTLRYNITSEHPEYPIKTKDIYAFCEEHGFDRKKAYRSALCLEEMVTNIVEHGFTKDDKPHSVDVRIVAKDDDLILRVRDDCTLFDVREKGAAWQERPDDLSRNIGIRMTMASAKDLKYINTLGTNTLIITV